MFSMVVIGGLGSLRACCWAPRTSGSPQYFLLPSGRSWRPAPGSWSSVGAARRPRRRVMPSGTGSSARSPSAAGSSSRAWWPTCAVDHVTPDGRAGARGGGTTGGRGRRRSDCGRAQHAPPRPIRLRSRFWATGSPGGATVRPGGPRCSRSSCCSASTPSTSWTARCSACCGPTSATPFGLTTRASSRSSRSRARRAPPRGFLSATTPTGSTRASSWSPGSLAGGDVHWDPHRPRHRSSCSSIARSGPAWGEPC